MFTQYLESHPTVTFTSSSKSTWFYVLNFLSIKNAADGSSSGLTRDELDASLGTLSQMAMSLESDIVLLRERNVTDGLLGDYLIRKIADEEDFQEVR